ncbi:MAG TPA: T9SS type A sorting domain-containing protein [bacterium]
MKPLFCVLSIVMLMSGLINAGQLCRSGNFIMEKDPGSGLINIININDRSPFTLLADTLEQLVNPGFETGSLPPWQSPMWQVTDIDSHTGQYCAADVGNYWIRQDITPVLTDSIVNISFWSRQPEVQIQAFDFIYDDASYDEDIVWVQSTWQRFDVTSYLPSGKIMVALRIWGYSGGPPGIDSTYMDDISILRLVEDHKIEEHKSASRQLEFNIHPNPVRGNALIECPAALGKRPMLSIFDINGAVIERVNVVNSKYTWSTKGLMSGVYFVRLDAGNGQSSVKKITVISD